MMRALCERLAKRLPPPRVIWDRNGVSPYLSRYYLMGRPRMEDGSDPFDRIGAPRRGVVWPSESHGVYLHHFHRGDDEPELHSHPWEWAWSLILAGGYIEEQRQPYGRNWREDGAPSYRVSRRILHPGMTNLLRHDSFHRVELLEEDAWTLFVTGPKITSWSFWSRDTGKETPWQEFISQVRDPEAFARAREG